MARTRTDSKGDPIAGNRKGPAATIRGSHGDSNIDERQVELVPISTEDFAETAAWFADHGGGHLKLRRDGAGSDYHLTWTWSLGKHAGTYVYVRTEHWRYRFGLMLLRRKIEEVEEGIRRPTPDKYH